MFVYMSVTAKDKIGNDNYEYPKHTAEMGMTGTL